MQIPCGSPVLTKPPPTAAEIFLILIFHLKQTCKVAPTVNC